MAANALEFDQAKARLVEWVRRRVPLARQKRAPLAKELRAIQTSLAALADRIEFGPAWGELDSADEGALKATLGHMRQLSDTAATAAAAQPNPRALPWLKHAASLFVHLFHHAGKPVVLYNASDAVLEFATILEQAGRPMSADAARKLLAKALAEFDPFLAPAELDVIVLGNVNAAESGRKIP